jgi:hypothetical protein
VPGQSVNWTLRTLASRAEHLGQHLGLADLGLRGGGEQGQGPVPGQLPQVGQGLGLLRLFQFEVVTAGELPKPIDEHTGAVVTLADFGVRSDA